MAATDLETILLPEDIARQTSLRCLSCRRRLGWVSYADQNDDGEARLTVTVSLVPGALEDFRQDSTHVVLICGQSHRSTFHLL